MSTLLSNEVFNARKRHVCNECRRFIEPGEVYRRQVYIDGDFHTYKAHVECYRACLDYNAIIGSTYDDEMYPLDECLNEKEDRDWLKEKFPNVAERMGIK